MIENVGDSDIIKLSSFIDWFSPTDEINQELHGCIERIQIKLKLLERIENAPVHYITYNSKGVEYDNIKKGSGTVCVKELGDM